MREVGARLPDFLAAHAAATQRPWLTELARLERALLEMVDGPDAEPLTIERLRARPPADFAALRLRLVPCHALFPVRHDVAALWRAVDPAAVEPEPVRATMLVWRREIEVFHRTVDEEEAAWLRRLDDAEVTIRSAVLSARAETHRRCRSSAHVRTGGPLGERRAAARSVIALADVDGRRRAVGPGDDGRRPLSEHEGGLPARVVERSVPLIPGRSRPARDMRGWVRRTRGSPSVILKPNDDWLVAAGDGDLPQTNRLALDST